MKGNDHIRKFRGRIKNKGNFTGMDGYGPKVNNKYW